MQHIKRNLLISLLFGSMALIAHSHAASVSHILVSFIALSILALAAIQSLIINIQKHLLKQHPLQTFPLFKILPSVETMQESLFKVIWAGFGFLTCSFLGAFVFLPNVLQNIPRPKLILSSLAWILFATLLYGYHRSGWTNEIVTTRTFFGVLLLAIAYFSNQWFEYR